MTNKKVLSVSTLALAAVLFLAVNLASNGLLKGLRLDLTESRLYTLSDGTKNILSDMTEPIKLQFFYSDKLSNELPQLKPYGIRVRELLEEYAARAKGKITLEIIDPEPFSDAEDRATQAGLQGVPLDQNSGRLFYFGLQGTNSTDRTEVIPFFQQDKEQFLEYDLTKLVYGLGDRKRQVVGVMGDMPLEYGPGGVLAAMRGQSQPYFIMSQLKERFETRAIRPDTVSIDPEISVLLLAHPKNLSEQAQYAVDQFVLRGGRALIFLDPFEETLAQQPGPGGFPNPGDSNASALPKLLKAWGVEMEAGKFVADAGLAIRVSSGDVSRRQAVDYVAWIAPGAENHDSKSAVVGDLGPVNFASAGALKRADGAETTLDPLFFSSDKAALLPVDLIRFRPQPEVMLAELKPTGERYVLAGRISGKVKSAFPEGPPPSKKDKEKDGGDSTSDNKPLPAHINASAEGINVIVVADADILEDRFWVRTQDFFGQRVGTPIASNGDFVVNAVDNLTGSNDLISLRSRGRSARPFDAVNELRRNAGQKFLAQEQALQKKLEAAERQMAELQNKKKSGGSSALLSAEEIGAIEGFRQEVAQTRKELRDVQLKLNQGIERLASIIKFINIGLTPILVAVVAIILALIGYRRRQSATRLR